MPARAALVAATSPLWRVERPSEDIRFSQINPVDALNDRVGNRFDVPGAGVLYAATRREGALAETLAGFRPRAQVNDTLQMLGVTAGRVPAGQVPPVWFDVRRMVRLTVDEALPFVDIEDPATHTALTVLASDVLGRLGIGNLDVATVRGPSRLLTRAVASWVYSQVDDHGHARYAGIRYVSRLGDFECWAIFEGTPVSRRGVEPITARDADVRSVMDLFGIALA